MYNFPWIFLYIFFPAFSVLLLRKKLKHNFHFALRGVFFLATPLIFFFFCVCEMQIFHVSFYTDVRKSYCFKFLHFLLELGMNIPNPDPPKKYI